MVLDVIGSVDEWAKLEADFENLLKSKDFKAISRTVKRLKDKSTLNQQQKDVLCSISSNYSQNSKPNRGSNENSYRY